VDLSNNKQITLGNVMYTNDYDDAMPPARIVPSCSDWWTSNMINWKDLVLPYIKNGGEAYNNGQTYSQTSGGGIFLSPMSDDPWSDLSPIYWGWPPMTGTGDETTRYPRSYAISDDAGYNEQNGVGIVGQVTPNASCNGFVFSGSGSATTLQSPATTILITGERAYFSDVWSAMVTYECTPGGVPAGNQTLSCVQGTRNRNVTVGFYDGHSKNVNAVGTLANDNWGSMTYYNNRNGSTYQQSLVQSAEQIPEWSTGQ
jgi:hypothetical protein